jgi:Acyl-CoA reductase (LuxC)
MTKQDRIEALVAWGERLAAGDEYLQAVMQRTAYHNPWFTLANQELALKAITEHFLNHENLTQWLDQYKLDEVSEVKVSLVMAGNLPLVGFHDVLCVLAAGMKAVVKLSDKDPYLLPAVLRLLAQVSPELAAKCEIVERLSEMQAVIATGSNNSARYFEAYFGKYPHIIRKNRHAVAVLDGQETPAELHALGIDVFRYFGLGCRNVSKLYVPKGYNFEPLLEALHEYRDIVLHTKYKNNFDYNFALFILNKVPYVANGCIMMIEEPGLSSAIATLHYEYYEDKSALETVLKTKEEEIQCIVASNPLGALSTIPFGKAQEPALWDYADGVDVMAFLQGLSE